MFVDRPQGSLFYESVDSGEPSNAKRETIVFLHGVAVTHEMWRHWLPVLSPGYRLLLLDMRGYGKSAGIGDMASWTLDDLSDDILAVADDAGVDRFHVVGESFGGTAVLNLAARRLDRVATATTVSAAHRGGQIERVRAWRADIERNGIAWWSSEMMSHRFENGAIADEERAWFQALQDATAPEPLLRMGEMLLNTDLTPCLPGIVCPVLLISPDRSPFVTPDIPVEILSRVATAELCVIPDSRHGIFFSHGAFCAEQLAAFLKRHAIDRD